MKKTRSNKSSDQTADDLWPEYAFDYAKSRPNRFATRVTAHTCAVVLDPDVAKVFTTPESVNAVLRALIATMPARGAMMLSARQLLRA